MNNKVVSFLKMYLWRCSEFKLLDKLTGNHKTAVMVRGREARAKVHAKISRDYHNRELMFKYVQHFTQPRFLLLGGVVTSGIWVKNRVERWWESFWKLPEFSAPDFSKAKNMVPSLLWFTNIIPDLSWISNYIPDMSKVSKLASETVTVNNMKKTSDYAVRAVVCVYNFTKDNLPEMPSSLPKPSASWFHSLLRRGEDPKE